MWLICTARISPSSTSPCDSPSGLGRLYCGCLRSEGRRRVNRVRTSPVAALSDARCRFGVPEALFFSYPLPAAPLI